MSTHFDPPNSSSRQPSKSPLKSATTKYFLGKENTAMEVPPVNGKENTKSIKVTEKITHVRDSVNEKGLSTDKFTSIFCDIPRVTSDDMVHHAISCAEKNPKKLIVHAGINNIYSNKEITANCKKKMQLCEKKSSKTELIFSKTCSRGDRKDVINEERALKKRLRSFVRS